MIQWPTIPHFSVPSSKNVVWGTRHVMPLHPSRSGSGGIEFYAVFCFYLCKCIFNKKDVFLTIRYCTMGVILLLLIPPCEPHSRYAL